MSFPTQPTGRTAQHLFSALLLVAALVFTVPAALAQQSRDYEIGIAGYLFDPLAAPRAADPKRLSGQALTEYQAEANYYLVQLYQPPTPEVTGRLRQAYGLRLTEYIPELAYIEYLAPELLDRLQQDDTIRAVVSFEPAFRLSPNVGNMKVRSTERKAMAGIWLRIVVFRDADPDAVMQALETLDVTQVETSDDRDVGGNVKIQFLLRDRDRVVDIARIKGVRWIEEVPESDDDNGNTAGSMQSGTAGITPVWDVGLHGEGQTISVMEGGGANINHCMYRDPVNPVGATHRKIGRVEASTNFHAHFVAGIAAGDDLNNAGSAANRGNAWASRLIFVRGRSSTNMTTQLTTSAANGAFVHTNSWHGINVNAMNQATYDVTSSEVDTFVWNNEAHVVLGSMGNIGEEQGPPGTAKNAIGINAGTATPNIMNFGDGNAGPTAGGRRKPDVVAPGCSITSAAFDGACGMTGFGCATSWATPAAAAASTMIRQYYVDGYYPSGSANPADAFSFTSGALVKATLINSAVDMTGIAGYPSNTEGWGLVRMDNSLYFNGDDHLLRVADFRNSNGLTTGGTRSHTINVTDDAAPLVVTLVWTDAPGAAGAMNPAVNNLDLRVVSPDGTQSFRGNVFAGGSSVTGGAADTLNNVEQVVIPTPAIGDWTILVDATAVNVGNPGQGYAVVARSARAPIEPDIQVPGDLDFADVCAGTSANDTLNVCNVGTANLDVSGISSSNPLFSISTPSGGFPVAIGPASCFPFQANFSPVSGGPANTTFSIMSNDPDSPVVLVQGDGNGTESNIALSGSTSFGTVSAWSSGEQDMQMCNTGACPLDVSAATVDCPDFTVDDSLLPTTLGPSACMDMTVAFTPTVPGPHSCTLTVNSDDPDTPAANTPLSARTPPAFSLHTGIADPHGALSATNEDGSTINLDFVHDVSPHWGWDVRLGVASLDGKPANPDVDIWSVLGNAKYTINPGAPLQLFLNGGGGVHHFDPGDTELGLNLGLGIKVPLSKRFSLEATYNYHNAVTASPDLEYDQLQFGLLISF